MKTLSDWLNEQEGFSLRCERVPDGAMPWIEAAWAASAAAEREACAHLADVREAICRDAQSGPPESMHSNIEVHTAFEASHIAMLIRARSTAKE